MEIIWSLLAELALPALVTPPAFVPGEGAASVTFRVTLYGLAVADAQLDTYVFRVVHVAASGVPAALAFCEYRNAAALEAVTGGAVYTRTINLRKGSAIRYTFERLGRRTAHELLCSDAVTLHNDMVIDAHCDPKRVAGPREVDPSDGSMGGGPEGVGVMVGTYRRGIQGARP